MNSFCTKCGAEVPIGSAFCPSCGTAVATATPASTVQPPPVYVQVPPPQYSQPAPASYPPAPPPTVSGGGALKIILIIVGVFVLLGVLAAGVIGFGVWRVSRAVRINSKGDGVSLSTPSGIITTGTASSVSEADLGVPVYPGAASGEGSMNIKTPAGSMITAIYLSPDPVSKVVDFYKARLGDQASIMETGAGTMISSGEDDKNKLIVTITQEMSKTKISIVHATNIEH